MGTFQNRSDQAASSASQYRAPAAHRAGYSETASPKLSSKNLGSVAVFTAEDKIPVLVPTGGKNQPTNWSQFKDCLSLYCRRHCLYWGDFIELRRRPTIKLPLHPRWRNMSQADVAALGDLLAPEDVAPEMAADQESADGDGQAPSIIAPGSDDD